MHSDVSLALLSRWQRDFPLCVEPFAVLGQTLGMSVGNVLSHYKQLARDGAISRIGAVFSAAAGGASILAAMAVPHEQIDKVAAIVSAHPGVNHNYEREHAVNLWFVVTGSDAAHVEGILQSIEQTVALPILRLPMRRAFRIDTAFDLLTLPSVAPQATKPIISQAQPCLPISASERSLAALAEQGLPLVERPFDVWSAQLCNSTPAILRTLSDWLERGALNRFGVVVRHHELGYTANAMAVFDVPEATMSLHANKLATAPGVTLTYQREPAPGWSYNLYCMVHGRDRQAVRETLKNASEHAGLKHFSSAVLFSVKRFKQTGSRRFSRQLPPPLPLGQRTEESSYAQC